jgi:hypothetical protein
MPDEQGSGDRISARISNVSGGQVAVGKDIRQSATRVDVRGALTPEELQQLATMFAAFRDEVARVAPPDVREEAIHQAEALEQATAGPQPDLSVMASARRWFSQNVPKLAGAVISVIVNPIVGKLVQAAGDAVVGEFNRRFPDLVDDPG